MTGIHCETCRCGIDPRHPRIHLESANRRVRPNTGPDQGGHMPVCRWGILADQHYAVTGDLGAVTCRTCLEMVRIRARDWEMERRARDWAAGRRYD